MGGELQSKCPKCGPGVALAPVAGPLRDGVCPRCGSALVFPRDVRRERARGRVPRLAILGAGGILATALAWWATTAWVDPSPATPARTHLVERSQQTAASEPPAPIAAAAADVAMKTTETMLLGGRPVQWWEDRLTSLRARTDPAGIEIFEATLHRAEANGLIVREEGGRLRVVLEQELLQSPPGGAR